MFTNQEMVIFCDAPVARCEVYQFSNPKYDTKRMKIYQLSQRPYEVNDK